MKKLLSMIMAIAMVASLALTAFATEDFSVGDTQPTDPNLTDSTKTVTSTVKSKVKAPTIKVTIPTQNNVFLNPYKMSVTVGTATNTNTIVSVPGRIKSESDVKLDFSVVVTGKPSTGVTLEKSSAAAKTTNSVYMYVYFKNTAAADTAVTAPETPAFSGDTIDSVLVQTTASKSTKVLTLAAADATTTAVYGAYLICGDIAAAPASPWTDKHTVDVTLAFSIAPVQASTT